MPILPDFALVVTVNRPIRPLSIGFSVRPIVHPPRLVDQGLGRWASPAAQVLSRALGKDIQYKQVSFEEFKQALQAGGKSSARSQSSRTLSAKSERTPEEKAGDDFLFQHLTEVAIDHQNGILAGTNDKVEKLGGRPPTTLEAFIEKHRVAFV